jgi:hypothetical protein
MKFFRANHSPQTEEDRARDLRLTYIASRYRPRDEGEASPDAPGFDDGPEEPDLFQ